MIETFYGRGQLDSPPALLAALVIGLAFGFALERAGFGSSRKLAGIFYFRDMTVLKVMFTALITAMLGLSYAIALGWIAWDQVYALPTIYRAQVLGGLLFGVGFVVSGWCPGTGAVGVASGKVDALVFLLGAVLGSVAFNEVFGLLRGVGVVPAAHESGVVGEPAEPLFAFGVSKTLFAFFFTLIAVGAFHGAEWIERRVGGGGRYLGSPFLQSFSLALVVFAAALLLLPSSAQPLATERVAEAFAPQSDAAMLAAIEAAEDHMEPEELADALLRGDGGLVVVDVRPPAEYAAFHLRGAANVALPDLPAALEPHKNRGRIVLYSNGMTHPAQARDALARLGYRNAYLLTDGLDGFVERCLKPVSLRSEPVGAEDAARIRAWRAFFLAAAPRVDAAAPPPSSEERAESLPGLADTRWLAERLHAPDVKLIDLRPQPKYNASHVPGSVCLHIESFRGVVDGVSSMLLPGDMLARHLSLMGVRPTDAIVLIYGGAPGEADPGNSLRDATLVGMGLERLGHRRWTILDGGFAQWTAEQRAVTAAPPSVTPSAYPAPATPDAFTVDYRRVRSCLGDRRTVILDTRPADYFRGEKSDEARAGHIPGAVNRPMKEDLTKAERLKPREELEAAYRALLPTKDVPVIVHCRTGHQASQTFFVLKRLLGYQHVLWYDASWTDWAARPELPVEK